ncbi:MAG: LuxR C-terminal-related transcriptional regulator [Methylophilus sp.]|nr:LuxR C-terminal-related transcriptional regulator [Methylophilus sp.]
MAEYLQQQKLTKLGIAIYALISTLVALDVISDYQEGKGLGHVAVELLVFIAAIIGLSLLARDYYNQTQSTVNSLKTDLVQAQQEAQRWREESRDLIQGLGVEIQKQFKRWELTQAEAEIGILMLKGFSHQEIADVRGASERTVREQARALYRKAGLAGRAELSAFFLEDLLLPSS